MVMSQNFMNVSIKTNRGDTRTQKTQIAKQNYWTSDDVHRIAMRTPSLYKTNAVPRVQFHMPFSMEAYDE